jgi:hypothetical protein
MPHMLPIVVLAGWLRNKRVGWEYYLPAAEQFLHTASDSICRASGFCCPATLFRQVEGRLHHNEPNGAE